MYMFILEIHLRAVCARGAAPARELHRHPPNYNVTIQSTAARLRVYLSFYFVGLLFCLFPLATAFRPLLPLQSESLPLSLSLPLEEPEDEDEDEDEEPLELLELSDSLPESGPDELLLLLLPDDEEDEEEPLLLEELEVLEELSDSLPESTSSRLRFFFLLVPSPLASLPLPFPPSLGS